MSLTASGAKHITNQRLRPRNPASGGDTPQTSWTLLAAAVAAGRRPTASRQAKASQQTVLS